LGGETNTTALFTVVSSFLCPSDGIAPVGLGGTTFGNTNYVMNAGWPVSAFETGATANFNYGQPNGMTYTQGVWGIGYASAIRYNDITDGTSKTALCSEWLRGYNVANFQSPVPPSNYDVRRIVWNYPAEMKDGVKLQSMHDGCAAITTNVPGDVATPDGNAYLIGSSWAVGLAWFGERYYHCMTPNTKSCRFNQGGQGDDDAISAASQHPGGVNIAKVDGSVSFMSDSVDLHIWFALGSRNGGESVPDGF
jgi:prepilin-type processing-associated H-X9-DG protein